MAHQELVENVSPRERTRRELDRIFRKGGLLIPLALAEEVLWEVVASEER